MKTILLTQGKVAVVDDCDFETLSQFNWFAMRNNRHWCAGRNAPKKDGKRGTIYMHRQIMGFPDLEVDHKDRDGLNNLRSNLRLATDLQQAANRTVARSSSGYRGVKKKSGRFDAAFAYDIAAKKQFGEFAVLNFP